MQERLQHVVTELDQTVHEIRTAIFDLHTADDRAADDLRRRLLDAVAEGVLGSGLSPSVRRSGAVVLPCRRAEARGQQPSVRCSSVA